MSSWFLKTLQLLFYEYVVLDIKDKRKKLISVRLSKKNLKRH
jgi:hypothetical protein